MPAEVGCCIVVGDSTHYSLGGHRPRRPLLVDSPDSWQVERQQQPQQWEAVLLPAGLSRQTLWLQGAAAVAAVGWWDSRRQQWQGPWQWRHPGRGLQQRGPVSGPQPQLEGHSLQHQEFEKGSQAQEPP